MRAFGSEVRKPTLVAVLDLIRERGTVSRVELAEATGLTQTSMTNAIRKLSEFGFVRDAGKERISRGTPRRLLELQPEACYMVGVQFDRFTSVGVLVDLGGRIVIRRELPVAGERDPDEVLPELTEAVSAMIDASGVPRSKVRGIGLATYGPQDRGAGVLLTPQPTPAWRGYPLAATLTEATGLPVVIENDATAAGIGVEALGEASSSFAVVFMAGGIGGGVIIDGNPYRGASSNGVELGHITVDPNGPVCDCGNNGCLDNLSGPRAISTRALEHPSLGSRLALGEDELQNFLAIGRAGVAGDADAAALLETSIRFLAIGAVTLVNMFDVGEVILAGSAFADFGCRYRDAVQDRLDRSVFMRHVHDVKVGIAEHVDDAAAFGAAMVLLRGLLETPSPAI
ncbi:ROK family transcriptional regulator [Glycomyces tenuis]|uniref:ROK family transcriptional regulator n=1 Tax=Glycomyces tenuis TaxID=58116 RepID=UPI000412E9C3|nr:ROK family transcriptional regulator [Glycomyces tenuis]